MDIISIITHNLLSFVFILSIIVFIHEFGHYIIAKICGVKIDEFSIGFGKEIFGFNDKSGTRWKFSILPLGGYVKMFGDKNPASIADNKKIKSFTKKEKAISFYFQNVYKRIAIVSAGPIANFILAIFLFSIIFKIQGITTILPIVKDVIKDGAAIEAGLIAKDKIIKIDDQEIKNFNQIQMIVSDNPDIKLKFLIERKGEFLIFDIIPKYKSHKDFFGNEIKIGMIGVSAQEFTHEKLNITPSIIHSVKETYNISILIFKRLGELLIGKRSIKELSGPIKIAEYSGKSVNMGFLTIIWFMAIISINLGVINLLPIPVLDGGHIFFYIIEAIRGKKIPEKAQNIGFQIGFTILITLMLFTIYNDLTKYL